MSLMLAIPAALSLIFLVVAMHVRTYKGVNIGFCLRRPDWNNPGPAALSIEIDGEMDRGSGLCVVTLASA